MEILKYPEQINPYNDVIVTSQTEEEETLEKGSLKLIKGVHRGEDKYRSKRIYGTVVAIPYKLRPERIHQVDKQFPKGTVAFSGERIQEQVIAYENIMGRTLQAKERKKHKDRYISSPYEPKFTYNTDQPILGRPGDTAWFHYLALSDQNYLGQDEKHQRYYRVPYENIFAFSNSKGITMVNGYVQVKPYWNSDFEEIEVAGKKIRGKLKGNLVVSLNEAPEYLTGEVVEKGACFGEDTRKTIKKGDIVIYAKGSEFTNTILGQQVHLMQQWQIIAKKEGNTFVPVGPYVQIKTYKIPPKKIVLVDHYKNPVGGVMEDVVNVKKQLEDLIIPVGDVLSCGELCEHVREKTHVYFNIGARVYNLEDTIFIHEGDVMAEYYGKYSVPTEMRLQMPNLN